MTFSRLTGMYDALPGEAERRRELETRFFEMARSLGFTEIQTPILEATGLFNRAVGEATDIVEKEMFINAGEESYTIRPEGTAGVVRAYIENSMYADTPIKNLVYTGPMFRFEKPQKGRRRQFTQMGVEAFGQTSPEQDAELMALAYNYLKSVGVGPVLEINTIGAVSERKALRGAIKTYLTPIKETLCPDCQRRLDTNPLRILDCKDLDCTAARARVGNCLPPYWLGEESKERFKEVQLALGRLKVPFTVSTYLFRGLDYYNDTVFELKSGGLGAQDAVGGGGRYDKLVETLGGPATPAFGFALGLDRIILAQGDAAAPGLDFVVLPLIPQAIPRAVEIATYLRSCKRTGTVDYRCKRLSNAFKYVDAVGAGNAIIIGEKELQDGVVQLRNMRTKGQVATTPEKCALLMLI